MPDSRNPDTRSTDPGDDRERRMESRRARHFVEGWAQVYSTTSEFEAQLVCENLHAEGIDAQLFSQKDRVLTVDLGELSIVRILVPAEEYTQAVKIIQDHMDVGGEVAFACPACGEAYEPGARECVVCGAPLA